MSALLDPAAGQEPTAAQLRTYKPLYARRTTDNSANGTSTTFANDGVLVISSLSINVEYEVHVHLLVKAANASNGGMKVQFTVPAGGDISNFIFHSSSPSGFGGTNASGSVAGLTLATTLNVLTIRGTLVMAATAGSINLQWAQNGASANASIVAAGSFIRLTQVT